MLLIVAFAIYVIVVRRVKITRKFVIAA